MPATTPRRLALAAAVAVALGAVALPATSASAAEVPLSGYELTWGIKQSYRSYVTGFAQGTFTTADGASQAAGNGAFTFTGGTGTYDSAAHTLHLAFRGTLTVESKAHGFTRELSDFRYDSADGVLTADLVADGGEKQQDVPLAEVAAPTSQDMTDLATTLTTQAGEFLGSSSYSGAPGDPLSVTKPTTTPPPTPTTPASPSPSPSSTPTPTPTPTPSATPTKSTSPSPTPTPSATPVTRGEIADGTLTWGVKESFRAYVVGPVAKGTITTSGGAEQAADNGVFTFGAATGSYDTDADTLSAAFEGAVTFKGHESTGSYGLDLTLGDLRASLDDGSGELTADVTGLGEKTEDVVLADLEAKSAALTAKDGVITLNDVSATLTDAGAQAFGGFYRKGTALDPVDLSVALTDDAELPSGDGESSTPGTDTGTGGPSGGVTGSTTGGVFGSLAATGSNVPATALAGAAAVAVAAGAGVVVAVRRRHRPAEGGTRA